MQITISRNGLIFYFFFTLNFCLPLVSGGRTAEAPSGKEGAWTWGDPKSHWGEQQLHQDGQGKAGTEDGGQQGESGSPSGSYAGTPARKGTPVLPCSTGKSLYASPHCSFPIILYFSFIFSGCVSLPFHSGQACGGGEEKQGAEGGSLPVDGGWDRPFFASSGKGKMKKRKDWHETKNK